MPRYIRCPRCELNYIKEDEELCDVCKAELKIGGMELISDEVDEEIEMVLCPVCGENYIVEGEAMCEDCRTKSRAIKEIDREEETIDTEEEWKEDIVEEAVLDEDNELSLNQLADDELEDLPEDEEEV